MLVAILSQTLSCLFLWGIAQYVAKWGIAQMCLCEAKYQGVVSHHFVGSANLPEKVSRNMGYRSDMGPLRTQRKPFLEELSEPKTGTVRTVLCMNNNGEPSPNRIGVGRFLMGLV